MSQKKDYSRLSQIDYCIQNYYSRYLAGSVEKTFKEVNAKRRQESVDTLKKMSSAYSSGNAFAPLSASLHVANLAQEEANKHGWNKRDDDAVAKMIAKRWLKNKNFNNDYFVLLTELYAEVLRKNGGKNSEQLRMSTANYLNMRLRECMIEQLARKKMPKSSANYIVRHSISDSFWATVCDFASTSRKKGAFEDETDGKAEKLYNPSKLEKAAALVGSNAIDWVTLGGVGGTAGSATKMARSFGKFMMYDLAARKALIPATNATIKYGTKAWNKITGDNKVISNTTCMEDASQELFHDSTAAAKIMAGSKAYGRTGTELISRVNDQLSKGHKIKVGRPTFSMEVKAESLKLCKASAGSSKRMLKSMTTFFDRQAIPYNSNARPPQWMAAKTSKQCRAFGSYFYGIAKQCSMERREGAKVNGKYMTLKAISQRAYDYAHAAVLLDEMTVARKAENARRSQPHSHRSGGHHYSPTSVSQSTPQYQTNGIQPVVDSQAQPATGSYVKQEVNPQLSGWQKGLQNMGLGDFGTLGQNLGYVFAMLPDMLIGMFTGKNQDMRLKDNLLPFASILMGMFTKNKLLKLMFMGMGGMSLLNNAGHAALTQREREEKKVRQYKIYQDEPLNPRIKNPVIKGKSMVCEIDGKNLVIQINKDEALYCYEKGILPLNVLANSVLKAYDREQSNIASEYDRQQNMQEENRQAVQLK